MGTIANKLCINLSYKIDIVKKGMNDVRLVADVGMQSESGEGYLKLEKEEKMPNDQVMG